MGPPHGQPVAGTSSDHVCVGSVSLGGRAIRELLDRHSIEPSRALGQNFVTDPNTIERIVRLADIAAGDNVVEIGPGLGSLTVGLVATGANVVAVELDEHLLAPLEEVLGQVKYGNDVDIEIADAMGLDWDEFFARRSDGSWKLIANLPYNVAAPVVLRALDEAPLIKEVLVLVQREVAERLGAGPGSAAYGIPSVKVAYCARAEVIGKVPAAVFHPVPKVESALVRITRLPNPATPADPDVLFGLVRRAFGQRRKMLRRSLATQVPASAFDAAGVDPTSRPQDLDIMTWGRLAMAVAEGRGD